MIISRLLNAQIELHAHRCWLTWFVARNGSCGVAARTFSKATSPKDRGICRPLLPKWSIPKPGWTASFAKKNLKIRKIRKANDRVDKNYDILRELRQAVQNVEIKKVTILYHSLNDKDVLGPNDFRTIAQCLHYSLRAEKHAIDAKTRREATEDLIVFGETLVKDVVGGKLVPHCQAHVHLLSFFKESGVRDAGLRFWKWLRMQDDLHVNPDVYGAAIELLAINGTPLRELETLYQQALDRFPGNFSAYHLSPGAIVPDRDQQTTLKGVPISLLQGILTARLLHGDSRNAYLALDTALRLYPDQVPPRFFQLFLEERPLLEAYTVFALACRGGILVPSNQFRQLLGALRTSSDLSSPSRHATAIRSMLSTLYLYIGAGGQLTQNVSNEIVIAITQFIRLKGVTELLSKQKQKIGFELMEIIRSLLLLLARYGIRPGLSAFNSIITNLGGFGHSKEMVGIALTDVKGLGLRPNEVTRRSILTAAGSLGDGEFVMKAWDDILQSRADSEQGPDATDFYVLIKSAAATGLTDFARAEFVKWKDMIPRKDHENIIAALDQDWSERHQQGENEEFDLASLFKEIKNVGADLMTIHEKTKQTPPHNFQDQPLPMTLTSISNESSLPAEEMRALYDELTTELRPITSVDESRALTSDLSSSGPEAGADVEPIDEQFKREKNNPQSAIAESERSSAVSPTNIPFSTLRYENWKTINYLMELARISDESYVKVVDAAIAAGVVPPQRTLRLTLGSDWSTESYGLSDALQSERKGEHASKMLDSVQIQEKRSRILSMRS